MKEVTARALGSARHFPRAWAALGDSGGPEFSAPSGLLPIIDVDRQSRHVCSMLICLKRSY